VTRFTAVPALSHLALFLGLLGLLGRDQRARSRRGAIRGAGRAIRGAGRADREVDLGPGTGPLVVTGLLAVPALSHLALFLFGVRGRRSGDWSRVRDGKGGPGAGPLVVTGLLAVPALSHLPSPLGGEEVTRDGAGAGLAASQRCRRSHRGSEGLRV
jgi:hypothetical protein